MISVLVCAAWLAPAGPVDLVAQSAALSKQVAAADWVGAARTARELERAVAEKAPLEIVDIEAVAGPPEGLGIYTPLLEGKVRGDELVVYAQVRNHGLRERAGFYELHLVSDLVILDAQGNELAKDEAFGESRFTSRAQHRDAFVVVALSTKGLAPGAYALRLVLHDRIANKSAEAKVGFTVP